jgi:hypothetical protein
VDSTFDSSFVGCSFEEGRAESVSSVFVLFEMC